MVPQTPEERDRIIMEHLPLVRALARRYANRGEPLDDLVQVGTVGLIKAVDRFDPSRGRELATFAAPTILGEIRRHFRDRAWGVHVPRGVQEAQARVSRVMDELSADLGRSPSVAEIAEGTGLNEEQVLDALAAGAAYRPISLSSAQTGPEDENPIEIAEEDPGFVRAEGRATLGDGLRRLPARERVILELRFAEGLTQSEIAARIGISQMHVSRLIKRSLETLRRDAGEA